MEKVKSMTFRQFLISREFTIHYSHSNSLAHVGSLILLGVFPNYKLDLAIQLSRNFDCFVLTHKNRVGASHKKHNVCL